MMTTKWLIIANSFFQNSLPPSGSCVSLRSTTACSLSTPPLTSSSTAPWGQSSKQQSQNFLPAGEFARIQLWRHPQMHAEGWVQGRETVHYPWLYLLNRFVVLMYFYLWNTGLLTQQKLPGFPPIPYLPLPISFGSFLTSLFYLGNNHLTLGEISPKTQNTYMLTLGRSRLRLGSR